jgi:hypothetical protein
VVHQKFNDPEIVLLSRIFSKKSTFQRFLETKKPRRAAGCASLFKRMSPLQRRGCQTLNSVPAFKESAQTTLKGSNRPLTIKYYFVATR